jgi:hypothetical protein
MTSKKTGSGYGMAPKKEKAIKKPSVKKPKKK